MSQREATDIQSLQAEVGRLNEENNTLSSHLKTTPTSSNDPSLHIDSDNEQEELKTNLADHDRLYQDLEEKTQLEERKTELGQKSDELKMRSQEIGTLQRRLEHVDNLNKKPGENVKTLTVPTAVPGQEGEHPVLAAKSWNQSEGIQPCDKAHQPVLDLAQARKKMIADHETLQLDIQTKVNEMGDLQKRLKQNHLDFEQETERILRVQRESEEQRLELERKIQSLELENDGLKMEIEKGQVHVNKLSQECGKHREEVTEMHKTNEQQRLRIVELEQRIEDLVVGDESLRMEVKKGQAHIDKLTQDHVGLVDHSKKQSETVLEYKDRQKILEVSE